MPNIAEYDWLMDISGGSQNVLHAPTPRIIAHYADYYDHGEHYWESEESAEALCGHRGSWSIPLRHPTRRLRLAAAGVRGVFVGDENC